MIPAVNVNDLRVVWAAWPALQEQAAGGLTIAELQRRLSPGADIKALIARCAVLQKRAGEPNFDAMANEEL